MLMTNAEGTRWKLIGLEWLPELFVELFVRNAIAIRQLKPSTYRSDNSSGLFVPFVMTLGWDGSLLPAYHANEQPF